MEDPRRQLANYMQSAKDYANAALANAKTIEDIAKKELIGHEYACQNIIRELSWSAQDDYIANSDKASWALSTAKLVADTKNAAANSDEAYAYNAARTYVESTLQRARVLYNMFSDDLPPRTGKKILR